MVINCCLKMIFENMFCTFTSREKQMYFFRCFKIKMCLKFKFSIRKSSSFCMKCQVFETFPYAVCLCNMQHNGNPCSRPDLMLCPSSLAVKLVLGIFWAGMRRDFGSDTRGEKTAATETRKTIWALPGLTRRTPTTHSHTHGYWSAWSFIIPTGHKEH